MRGNRWARIAVLALLLTGLTASGYLVHRSLHLLSAAAAGDDVCAIAFGISCDETLRSDASWFSGLPLAGWGVVYYVLLFALWIAGASLREQFQPEADTASLLIAIIGAGGSVALLVMLARLPGAACPFCLLIHAINLLLVPSLWRASAQTWGGLRRRFVSVARWFSGADEDRSRLGVWRISAFLNALLVALLAYQWLYVEVQLLKRRDHGLTPRQVVEQYDAAQQFDVTTGPADARLGPVDAPAELVAFSSFQCPGCHQFARQVPALRKRFGDQLTIVFKHYPLSSQCNPRLHTDRHPLACAMASASIAALQQNRFWEFHDRLFALPRTVDATIINEIAQQLGLDLDRFETDRLSPQTAAQLQSDVALGTHLKIDATPELFLNGKLVPSRKSESLASLIEHVLARDR